MPNKHVAIHFVYSSKCKTKEGSNLISGLQKPVILSTFFMYTPIHANEILAAISGAQKIQNLQQIKLFSYKHNQSPENEKTLFSFKRFWN